MGRVHNFWADHEMSANVVSFTELNDLNQPHSCNSWGQEYENQYNPAYGNDFHEPLLVSGPVNYGLFNMFNSQNGFPSNAFIDHEMKVHFKTNNTGWYYANFKIQEMLDACEPCNDPDIDQDGTNNDIDNCPNDFNPEQLDTDYDGIGDECDDCNNLLGDVNDDSEFDVLDIVVVVNMVLAGGINSNEHDDCEKGDADYDGNGAINVLDIIQIINLILDNRSNPDKDGFAVVSFQKIKNDLHLIIKSNTEVGGVEMSFGGNSNNVELLNNSHIETVKRTIDGVTRVISYSMLNDAFDSYTTEYVISSHESFDVSNFNILVSSTSGHSMVISTSILDDAYSSIPYGFELSSIYPNPFNPSTEVTFSLPVDGDIRLSVYNLQGQEVEVIHSGYQSAGKHSYIWSADGISSGVYYVRLISGNKAETMKAVLMK